MRLVVALDPDVGVSPLDLAEAWSADGDTRELGNATVEVRRDTDFFPEPVALVVIPLLVNLASNAVYDLVRRLLARLRSGRSGQADLELVEITVANGDRVLVVRLRGDGQ